MLRKSETAKNVHDPKITMSMKMNAVRKGIFIPNRHTAVYFLNGSYEAK